uniref:Uncharacterized protein n=1 Tax=Acrobeloides nanus TaxID=290746 RepID=A0A914DSV6_9BILA
MESKVIPKDLLTEGVTTPSIDELVQHRFNNFGTAAAENFSNNSKKETKVVPHSLLVEGVTTPSIAGLVEHRRNILGTAAAEHFINELNSASKINRGPPGVATSSRLHLDILLNREETISPGDYLNFHTKDRW